MVTIWLPNIWPQCSVERQGLWFEKCLEFQDGGIIQPSLGGPSACRAPWDYTGHMLVRSALVTFSIFKKKGFGMPLSAFGRS